MRLLYVVFASLITTLFSTLCQAQLSEVLLLTLSYGSQSDQTAIRFLPEATDSFDSGFDGYKLINPPPTPNIYTVSDQEYSLNALNNNFTEKTVSLRIGIVSSATYTITAEEMGKFEASWSILLIDHVLNGTIDLRKDTSYSFSATTTDPTDRFSLKFIKSDISSTEDPSLQQDTDKLIHTQGDKIIVSLTGETISSISINNLAGQSAIFEINSTTWTSLPNKDGVYVVHVLSNKNRYIKKVLIY